MRLLQAGAGCGAAHEDKEGREALAELQKESDYDEEKVPHSEKITIALTGS